MMEILGIAVIVGMLLVVTHQPARELQTERINRRR